MRNFGSGKNDKWEAFGHVMKNKGLPLVIMIRWCPLPFAIGNGLFAVRFCFLSLMDLWSALAVPWGVESAAIDDGVRMPTDIA